MDKSIKAHIENLKHLLKKEKEEDFEQHRALMQTLTIDERRKKGMTWYPVQVIKSGYGLGERAFVEVERTKEGPSQFRAGKMVQFFTLKKEAWQPEKSGIIKFVDKNKMRIILNSKDLPEWLNQGETGVDLLFDERTYLEMERALKELESAQNNRLADLRDILLGQQSPLQKTASFSVELPQLNPSQNKAVNQILLERDIAVIHGPPGTGKTTTLVQGIKQLTKVENTVLVCAPSNAAVDLLTEKLSKEGLMVVRVGNISRVEQGVIEHTLESHLSRHPESKNIKKVKIEAAKCRRDANRFKRRFGAEERTERKHLRQQARELMDWATQLEKRLLDQILSSAQVITTTLVSSNNLALRDFHFKTVVIDEAAQALEPATWIPIIKADKVILAGDPYQLPPTVKSNEAQREGFNITLLEHCIKKLDRVSLLDTQYRMNKIIMGFSNEVFYEGALQADEKVKDWLLDIPENGPLEFVDTAGCGFDEKLNEEFRSRFNPDEFNILREHLYQLLECFKGEIPSIGIISPYREQVIFMSKGINLDEKLKDIKNITIDTIDAFQGQERDVIYISLVRSNEKGEIGFLSDYRRMNVAMTRARKKLIVIGDSATLGNHKFFQQFIEYCEKNNAYRSAWEFMS